MPFDLIVACLSASNFSFSSNAANRWCQSANIAIAFLDIAASQGIACFSIVDNNTRMGRSGEWSMGTCLWTGLLNRGLRECLP